MRFRVVLTEDFPFVLHACLQVTAKVHQRGSTVGARDKRQTTYEPIRILFHYDTTIDTM